jgi:hypothetical protein
MVPSPPGQVTAAEDVAEDDDQQPDPDEEQEESQHGPEDLTGPELRCIGHGLHP